MNIGIVTQWFPSGAGYVSRNYAEALSASHRVSIYARGGRCMRGDPVWDDPRVTWAPRHILPTAVHARHFARWVRAHAIEAVFFNEQRHWSAVVLARRLGLLTGGYVDYYTQDTVPFFDLYDFLVCNTRRHHGVFAGHPQCLYLPWGTQANQYRLSPSRPERPLTFLISAGWDGSYARAATWMDRRGAGLALRVFPRVAGNCRLLVYGQEPLSQCPAEWQAAVRADARSEFRTGTFDPFPYHEGDVYLYPSRLDGIGLTLPEALSAGLPAITTDAAPMNEFVRHGENGLLVAVREQRARPDGYYWPESLCDEEALAEALRAYARQPDLAARHAAAARARAEQTLDWSRNAAGLADWLAGRRRLAEDPRLAALARRAHRYDFLTSPTPLQHLLIGGHTFYRHWRGFLARPGHRRWP